MLTVNITGSATGTAPISYQWRRNNVNIEGATASVYNVGSVTPANAGSYTCVVSNSCNTQTSNPGVVTVNDTTAITAQPTGGATCAGGSPGAVGWAKMLKQLVVVVADRSSY